MVNIFKPAVVNHMVACLTIAAFSTGALVSTQLQAASVNLDLRTINFGIKVEKIFEKVKKAIDKGETNKIVGYMFDIKEEVEQYTGVKIDPNTYVDAVQKQAKARAKRLMTNILSSLRKTFANMIKSISTELFGLPIVQS